MGESDALLGMSEKYWKICSIEGSIEGSIHTTPDSTETTSNKKLEDYFRHELHELYPSKHTFPKMFKIIKILISKGVLGENELILSHTHWTDFIAFTQRPVFSKITPSTDDFESNGLDSSQSSDTELDFGKLGFSYNLNKKNKKQKNKKQKNKNKKKQKKNQKTDFKQLCKDLKKRGVLIPHSLLKNPEARLWL